MSREGTEGAAGQCDRQSSGVGSPTDISLPLFAYGLLQPGELAHRHVVGPGAECQEATLRGAQLRLRDGLPLLVEASTPRTADVHGYVIRFAEPGDAYERIGSFEPRKHYRWEEKEVVSASGETLRANVLVGRSPGKGTSPDPLDRWQGRLDPVLCFGFPVVGSMVRELADPEFPVAPGDSAAMWDRFFRLSGTYLLLWSIVERYTALRFGPGVDPHARVRMLDDCEEFRAAVQTVGVNSSRPVVDSRDPSDVHRIRPDGSRAASYWYAVRSNLSHRGKSAFQDGQLLRQCTQDLHGTMAHLLQRMT